tara:strand:+ start:185 stop:481 length:297 start_codon:yes stop_codon:yes gene_type:complete
MKITRLRLEQIIREEIQRVSEIRKSNVGSDYSASLGGMSIAKYPGPWASGSEPLIFEDEDDEEQEISLDGDAAKERSASIKGDEEGFGGATIEESERR